MPFTRPLTPWRLGALPTRERPHLDAALPQGSRRMALFRLDREPSEGLARGTEPRWTQRIVCFPRFCVSLTTSFAPPSSAQIEFQGLPITAGHPGASCLNASLPACIPLQKGTGGAAPAPQAGVRRPFAITCPSMKGQRALMTAGAAREVAAASSLFQTPQTGFLPCREGTALAFSQPLSA